MTRAKETVALASGSGRTVLFGGGMLHGNLKGTGIFISITVEGGWAFN